MSTGDFSRHTDRSRRWAASRLNKSGGAFVQSWGQEAGDHERHSLRATTIRQGADLHGDGNFDFSAWNWRDHCDFYAGACSVAELPAGEQTQRTLSCGRRGKLLREWRPAGQLVALLVRQI